mgnify:CR=1 FL=1
MTILTESIIPVFSVNVHKGIMNKKQELINRIEKLTPEQFELLLTLFAQQEQESVQVDQSDRQTFLRSCG